MSAPALVVLGYGSRDARAPRVVQQYAQWLSQRCAGVAVDTAFLRHGRSSAEQTVARLAGRGHAEIVVVPLLLTGGRHAVVELPAAVERARAAHPDVRIVVAERLGLRPAWLGVLDERLRTPLRHEGVRELDALVLASAGSTDPSVSAAVGRLARTWSQAHRLPVVTAYAAVHGPSSGEAVRALRREGRRHVAVGSLFLAPGAMSDRTADLALEAGATAVSEPLGFDETLAEQAMHRYQVAAMRSMTLV